MSDERVTILTMLKDGKITVEEAEALLDALGEERASAPDDAGETGLDPAGLGRGL